MLDELLARVKGLPGEQQAAILKHGAALADTYPWTPHPGPQTMAYLSSADVLGYGGEAGGGKSDLLIGLAMIDHVRSLLMRRQYTDTKALQDRAIEVNGTRKGYNGSIPPRLVTPNGRLIEFGACKDEGDEQNWKGRPYDLYGFDEVVDFTERQVRFIMTWNRSADPDQRCRVVMATNPPVTIEGQWFIPFFGPWLDPEYPDPAKDGELRWFVTAPDGTDVEVAGPDDLREWDGDVYRPKSRTFIRASLKDNPKLSATNYQSTLDALPEPYRSAYRDGNFMVARQDRPLQLIPTSWVLAAQHRWTPRPPLNVPMCSIGVDCTGGGNDPMVLARRHDGWFDELVSIDGRDMPVDALGSHGAGIVVANRRDGALVVVDLGGGYGNSLRERLKDNDVEVYPFRGSEGSKTRTSDRQHGFSNVRCAAYWKFREALDPDQDGGSPIVLPNDRDLLVDLTAPDFEIKNNKIHITPKEKLVEQLGRSTDKGDAVVMAWYAGLKQKHVPEGWRPDQRVNNRPMPKVVGGLRRR